MAFRRLRERWHKLSQETEWHSYGAPIFDSKLPTPTRPQVYAPAERKKSRRDAGPTCCSDTRDTWREAARKSGLLPAENATHKGSDASLVNQDRTSSFLNLPVEIREQIYCLVFESWGDQSMSTKPIPPYESPICRVSKQIRKESLMLFFSTWRFPIIAHLKPEMCYSAAPHWYRKLHSERLQRMRRFKLYFCFDMVQSRLGPSRQEPVIYHIDIDSKSRSFTITRISGQANPTLRLLDLDALHIQVVQNVQELEQKYAAGRDLIPHDLEMLIPASIGL